jgi:hypothetical protein
MSTTDVNPADYLTADERAVRVRALTSPEDFPQKFGAWLANYVAINGKVNRHQIDGLSRLTPHTAEVLTSEAKSWDATYGDLATVGPELTDLGKGTYLVMFGAEVLHQEASVESSMTVSINGATALSSDGVTYFTSSNSNWYALRRYIVLDLPLPSNTLVCKYRRVGDGATTANFKNRSLVAIRVGS